MKIKLQENPDQVGAWPECRYETRRAFVIASTGTVAIVSLENRVCHEELADAFLYGLDHPGHDSTYALVGDKSQASDLARDVETDVVTSIDGGLWTLDGKTVLSLWPRLDQVWPRYRKILNQILLAFMDKTGPVWVEYWTNANQPMNPSLVKAWGPARDLSMLIPFSRMDAFIHDLKLGPVMSAADEIVARPDRHVRAVKGQSNPVVPGTGSYAVSDAAFRAGYGSAAGYNFARRQESGHDRRRALS